MSETPRMTPAQESAILIRLAQKYAFGNLPEGVSLGGATQTQLTAAIKRGMKKARS